MIGLLSILTLAPSSNDFEFHRFAIVPEMQFQVAGCSIDA
jgi:hypothetical protein